MKLHFLHDHPLSAKAQALAEFDMDSIRQVIAAKHSGIPDIWLADPDLYEQNGRVLRDSTSPRLLAYSPEHHIIYATDGCNSCEHRLGADLGVLSADDSRILAQETGIRVELLESLRNIARSATE